MIKKNKIICIIPARGGSKGVPGKNIKILGGKPLIAYTIEQALKSQYIDRIIVSTDDLKIAAVAKRFGAEVPFTRPHSLARDNSGTIDVLLHALDWLKEHEYSSYDVVVLLHVTTPLRNVQDIDTSIELLINKKAESVFTVAEAHRNPYFNMVEVHKNGRVTLAKEGNFVTRQSAPKVFDMNSSIYVWWTDVLRKKKKVILEKSLVHVMPKERSVDIDDLLDFKFAETLLKENKKNVKKH